MSFIRIVSSLIPAVIVTMGLFLLMHFLIESNMKEPEAGNEFKIPDITMAKREVSEEFNTEAPDKPDEVEEPPPDIPEPEFESQSIDNSLSVAPKVNVKINIGGVGGFSSDGDYLPIVKVQPKYPNNASARGIQGYCVVEYTVTITGETENVVEADCPQKVFLRESIKAAKKFKYKPKVIDGEPIAVAGVRNRFIFELADE